MRDGGEGQIAGGPISSLIAPERGIQGNVSL